jgi:hypothetical protein
MQDPTMAEVWQTAFGKDFGSMAQGNNKMGQKGTNSVFIMAWKEIDGVKAKQEKWTYARILVDFQPQKDNPNQIRIAMGGNLINYNGDTPTRTVDLTMSKLLWKSGLSVVGAKYMCLDLNFFISPSPWIISSIVYENSIGIVP